eukprot:5938798-Amphidinium_carterae.1
MGRIAYATLPSFQQTHDMTRGSPRTKFTKSLWRCEPLLDNQLTITNAKQPPTTTRTRVALTLFCPLLNEACTLRHYQGDRAY